MTSDPRDDVDDPDDVATRLDELEAATAERYDGDVDSRHLASVDDDVAPADEVRENVTVDDSRGVAACRYCQHVFDDREAARDHGDDCPERPLAECRFCGHTHTVATGSNPDEHFYGCQRFREWYRHRVRTGSTSPGASTGDDLNPFSERRVVRPWYHEFSAYIKFDTSDRAEPFRWFYGLEAATREFDGHIAGDDGATFEIGADDLPDHTREVYRDDPDRNLDDGPAERWRVELRYSESGLDHPPADVADRLDWRLETVREFRVYVFPAAYPDYETAKDEGRARAYYRLRPRWPDQTANDGDVSINPVDLVGSDVETSGTNLEFKRYPDLLRRALDAIRDRQGAVWNSPTRTDPDAFRPEAIHSSSNVTDAELYVRLEDGETGRLIAIDGPIHRISLVLAGDREGYSKTVRDDRKKPGHYHTATVCQNRASRLVGGHTLAKEVKHYYVRNPDAVDGALANPKLGASYQNSISDETVYWDDLDEVVRELDETILNVLKWGDVSLRARGGSGGGPYVADDYFRPVGSSRFRKLVDDPTPRLESEQENAVEKFAVLGNLNETQIGALRTLVTDGGQLSPADIANEIGKAVSTVRKALRQLGELVVREYGDVQLRSQYLAQELVRRLDAADAVVSNDLEGAADDLARVEGLDDDPGERSPWERWRDAWVADERASDDGHKSELVLGWECADRRELRRLIREGALKWSNDHGVDAATEFARHYRVVGRLRSGETVRFVDEWLRQLIPGDPIRNPG